MANRMFDLTGKVAVVTGGSRGIGRSICENLARAGAKVVVSSRKLPVCEEVVAAIKKDKRLLGMRAKAAGWALGFVVLLLFPAFWLIPQQIYIRVNRQATLMTPGDPVVVAFTSDFLATHPSYAAANFSARMAIANAYML